MAERVRIVQMTSEFAAEMTTWRYPPPYRSYDLIGADPAYFTDPANGFRALVNDEGALLGFRSFGLDGRVPGGAYDDSALDTGGGLRPDLTGLGRGLGRQAIATGLAYGREHFCPAAFRVTVAAFNTRARRVVESLGFEYVSTFNATTDGAEYNIFVLR
ncbi:GNAT family N-acetyltransferase [Nocardia anaemiae]|uniref:GNAT family N-acetyltransferase n=1 Tax=Nocardia anaemiae TaxID=263910 RepID=UPI0012F4F16D|nr:GNAT family N-acetyltransferase [Nocardia anaemiae]